MHSKQSQVADLDLAPAAARETGSIPFDSDASAAASAAAAAAVIARSSGISWSAAAAASMDIDRDAEGSSSAASAAAAAAAATPESPPAGCSTTPATANASDGQRGTGVKGGSAAENITAIVPEVCLSPTVAWFECASLTIYLVSA